MEAILESKEIPQTEAWLFRSPPEEGYSVEFRLIYRGPLPAEPSLRDKHLIRQALHPQLATLWAQSPLLSQRGVFDINPVTKETSRIWDKMACKVATKSEFIYRFVPLIGEGSGVSCSVDVLFLRRDATGGPIRHGGDIDNRMKALFDALRRPHGDKELLDISPMPTEDPFFCLLEDDKYIDSVSITTDRLLLPQESSVVCTNCGRSKIEHVHEVLLVIDVKTVVFNFQQAHVSLW